MLFENIDIPVIEINKDDSELPTVAGIYAYINEENGKLYIGKAVNLRQRYRQHKYNKTANEGSIDYALYNTPEEFNYRILVYGVDPSILESLEGSFIQRYGASKIGYNIRDDKGKNITPDESLLSQEYSKLRLKYMNLYQSYVELNELYTLSKKGK